LHPDEVSVGRPLVARLIAAQFPQWERLPLTRVGPAGTDNTIYRLGEDLAVRLPRRSAVAAEADRLQRWLPRLAPQLPLEVAAPLACGVPGEGFPFPWLVCRWLDGQVASDDPGVDPADPAVRLGRFVAALHAADATGAPPTPFRGGPLSRLDDRVRGDIAGLDGTIDTGLVTAAWERALAAPDWDGGPVWVHADLSPLNLLTRQHRLAAVIDFGGLGAGDPAVDLLPAWSWLTGPARALFRAEVEPDDATWARGRGWALSLGLGFARHYQDANPALAASGHQAVTEVLAERAVSGLTP